MAYLELAARKPPPQLAGSGVVG